MIKKFNVHSTVTLEQMQQTTVYELHTLLQTGERLSLVARRQIETQVNQGISVRKGCYPLHGWSFDFGPWLNLYWVKHPRSGDIREVYAFTKAGARKIVGHSKARVVLVTPASGLVTAIPA